MASRGLNKIMLIGNLTRDPELRYTPAGVAVCSFGVATNRSWTSQSGEAKEDVQFHKIIAWNKLGELCSKLLVKGRRVYVEGRIQYREYVGNDGVKKQTTEIIIEDMTILDSRRTEGGSFDQSPAPASEKSEVQFDIDEKEPKKEKQADKKTAGDEAKKDENMPF